ncbi:MAG: nanoRNase/pAp phosphatase (c-di-AMP/oligoRNAs hydrolase) [Halobacteriales archaeon]
MIDHHPADDVDARFVDHREEIGGAATILVEYVRALDIEPDDVLATALLFAIRRETLNFLRGATREEYDAAGYLHEHADPELLRKLSTPSVTGATLDAIATAIGNRTTKAATLVSHVGRTTERDAVPQAADYLATLEGVETAIVFGIVDEAVHLSARSSDARVHVGNVLREAFEDVGSAGGHHDVAGGEIPLGIFADFTTDDEGFLDSVEQVITDRIFDELDLTDESDE